MKVNLIIVLVIMLILTGCIKYDKPVVEEFDIEVETGFYNELSIEQIKYIDDMYNFGEGGEYLKTMINEMSYEELNLALMFSGLELYNKPPKAAYEGITYSYKDRVDPTLYGKYYKDIKCTNDKKITLKEVYAICDKPDDITVEKFLEYSFERYDISDSENQFVFPVDGYEDVTIRFKVKEYEDGTVEIGIIYLKHLSDAFSLFYERERFDVFANQEPKYSDEGKIYVILKNGSLSNRSLVLDIENYTDKEYILDNSYILYKLDDTGKYIKYKEYESENIELLCDDMNNSIRRDLIVPYATKDNPLPAGKYKLEFGKDREGYVYKEIEFEIE